MIEKQLREWKAAEQAAEEAESLVLRTGAGTSVPPDTELLARATELRRRADALMAALLATVPQSRP